MEKRTHSRRALRLAVEVARRTGAEKTTEERRHAGHSRDLSLGGVFVESDQALPFRSEVVVYLRLPGSSGELALGGVVRWTSPEGMGIQFAPMGARETHAITEALRKA